MEKKSKLQKNKKRFRVRRKFWGTEERPRLMVYRSLTQIYVQLVDDNKGHTIVSASSLSKEIADEIKNAKTKVEKSKIVGKHAAKLAADKGIKTVVFDRNVYQYHGRVKAVAEGAREGGLKF